MFLKERKKETCTVAASQLAVAGGLDRHRARCSPSQVPTSSSAVPSTWALVPFNVWFCSITRSRKPDKLPGFANRLPCRIRYLAQKNRTVCPVSSLYNPILPSARFVGQDSILSRPTSGGLGLDAADKRPAPQHEPGALVYTCIRPGIQKSKPWKTRRTST